VDTAVETKPVKELLQLSGKTAIVTGGAMGIGLGIVHRLAEAGAKVYISDLNHEVAENKARELAAKGYTVKSGSSVDVSVENDVMNMVKQCVTEFGSIDILVNNAGIYPNIPFSKMTLADFEKVLHVNLLGVFLCTKYVSEQMIAQGNGGKIINITSVDAIHPSMIGLAHYDASKHGVWGFTKNIGLELASHKIWVNAIAPGGIMTEGVKGSQADSPAPQSADMTNAIEAFMKKIPMHRMGDPDEIGKVALFLASDMSSYMTGSQIVVDGGVLLS
jgi:2-deoxy-D-gluconate 3-dehydrogenase